MERSNSKVWALDLGPGSNYRKQKVRKPPAGSIPGMKNCTPEACVPTMKRLLLVEDDRSLGATLHERLLREKYDVAWVETKHSALTKLNEGLWDLVILDIGLPDGSGFELARHIKSNATMPIMFMTALSTAEHRLEGFEIGAEEFVPKPFHLKELLLRVKHVLDRYPVRHQITCNGRVIELEGRVIVQPDGRREHPAARDFDLLQLLITGSPGVISRNQILD